MRKIINKTLMIVGALAIDIAMIAFCVWLISWSLPFAFSMTLVCSVWGAKLLLAWIWKDARD